MKRQLKAGHYFRYCDDFVIVHTDRKYLGKLIEIIGNFLREKLLLDLHPNKVEIRNVREGVDFLGYVVLPHVIVIRTKTKKRMLRKLEYARKKFMRGDITKATLEATVASYLGILKHCRNKELRAKCYRIVLSVLKT